jgi:hypothetical protein
LKDYGNTEEYEIYVRRLRDESDVVLVGETGEISLRSGDRAEGGRED